MQSSVSLRPPFPLFDDLGAPAEERVQAWLGASIDALVQERIGHIQAAAAAGRPAPTSAEGAKQYIVLRKDLNMRKGKFVSQGAHASGAAVTQGGIWVPGRTLTLDLSDTAFESWLMGASFKKIVLGVSSEADLMHHYERVAAAGLRSVLITDSGLTEFGGVPTRTAFAVGPHWPEDVEPFMMNQPGMSLL